MTTEPRVWQRMLSGRRLNLVDPSPLDIEIEDIAHGLARVNRWSGQTTGDFGLSVAQHSVLVLDQLLRLHPRLPPELRLACLLHDAAEYVIGDLISPFKQLVAGQYNTIEERLQHAIHQRFGLPHPLPKDWHSKIKQADRNIAWYEATQLAGFSPKDASSFIAEKPKILPPRPLIPLAPFEARAGFIERFATLDKLTRKLTPSAG